VDPGGLEHDPVLDRFGELSGGGRRTPITECPGDGRRSDGFVDVEAQQEHLTGLHRAELDLAGPPVVPPEPRRARFAGVAAHRGLQVHADRWWRQLRENVPATVRHRLEQAFAVNDFGAAVTGVHGGVASLVLGVAPVGVLVGRWERPTGGGRLARLPMPERHRLHATMIRSALTALAAEAVAVAPGLAEVRCGVLQAEHPEGRPALIALAALPRDDVLSGRTREQLAEGVDPAGRSRFHLAPIGSAGALAPLDRELPVVSRVLAVIDG
jgi:hypothetical protein